ncbi:hypothetical protein MMC24_007568 [Lignoscripta atroalba]|nr:hypothetical protein [Lignoscripta atroalba]
MAGVLSASQSSLDSTESHKTLTAALDELLEQYLNLLDQYQILRQSLAKRLSSGYMSLAQANFNSPNRVRYGQDFYDDRTQALVRISIKPSDPTFSISKPLESPGQDNEVLTTPFDSESFQTSASGQDHQLPKTPASRATSTRIPGDPLKWFGILVPPSLRSAQADFRAAIIEGVPALANAMLDLRAIEKEVARLRGEIAGSHA